MQNCPNELKLFNYYKTLKPKTKARILRVLKSLFNFYEVPAEGRRVAGGLESKNPCPVLILLFKVRRCLISRNKLSLTLEVQWANSPERAFRRASVPLSITSQN